MELVEPLELAELRELAELELAEPVEPLEPAAPRVREIVLLAFDPVEVKLYHCAEFAGTFTCCEPLTAVAFFGSSVLPMVDIALELALALELAAELDEALDVVPDVVGTGVGALVVAFVLDEALDEALDVVSDVVVVGVACGPVTAIGEPPSRIASPVTISLYEIAPALLELLGLAGLPVVDELPDVVILGAMPKLL